MCDRRGRSRVIDGGVQEARCQLPAEGALVLGSQRVVLGAALGARKLILSFELVVQLGDGGIVLRAVRALGRETLGVSLRSGERIRGRIQNNV